MFRLRKNFDFLQGNRNESTSGYKSLLDIIPLGGQHTEKPSIATVTHGEVNDLRWSTVQQRSIVEVRVFTKDNQTLQSSALPNLRVGGRQQISIKKMFGFVTLRSQPNTQAWRKIRVDKKLHLVSGISRWAT
ncbi:MAG TPA: hypothetical protein VFF31_13430 [Blastocatellia bacterium]|nr:hypothetical protein [Blastocatellia bacterium]